MEMQRRYQWAGFFLDIRLSKDKQLMMMHDLTLQRTTTGMGPLVEHEYFGDMDQLRTKVGDQPLSRLNDVLDFLVEPGLPEDLWMIIDIKFDNALEIMDLVHELVHSDAYKDKQELLQKRVVLGIWRQDFLAKTRELFGDAYKVCFIGLSVSGARKHFLGKVDYLSMAFPALADADGLQFMRDAQAANQKVLSWTINTVEQMHTCVVWGVDGIIGDHIDLMLEQVKADTQNHMPLKLRRTQLYYYCIKKIMSVASYAYIGV